MTGDGAPPSAPTARPLEAPPAARVWRVATATAPELGEAIRRAGDARRVLALLPLGATEQHGPHLPCGTDTMIAQAVTERVASELARGPFGAGGGVSLILPSLAVAASDEHGGFPGLVGVGRETLVQVLLDLAARLGWWGVGRLAVVNAHGGNVDALGELAHRLPEVVPHLALSLPRPPPLIPGRRGVSSEAAGLHAGEAETSALLAIHPELVRWDRVPAPEALAAPETVWARLRRAPVAEAAPGGVIGDPRQALPARGVADLDRWATAIAEQLAS